MTHKPTGKAVKILDEIIAHVERLESLPPAEAVAIQRTHSLACCIRFRAWIRSGRDSVRGIALAKACEKAAQDWILASRAEQKHMTSPARVAVLVDPVSRSSRSTCKSHFHTGRSRLLQLLSSNVTPEIMR
jgi:hypothetical protein